MNFELRPENKIQVSDLILFRVQSGGSQTPSLELKQISPLERRIPLNLRDHGEGWWGTEFTLETEGFYKIHGDQFLKEFAVVPRKQLLGGAELFYSALGSFIVLGAITLYAIKRVQRLRAARVK